MSPKGEGGGGGTWSCDNELYERGQRQQTGKREEAEESGGDSSCSSAIANANASAIARKFALLPEPEKKVAEHRKSDELRRKTKCHAHTHTLKGAAAAAGAAAVGFLSPALPVAGRQQFRCGNHWPGAGSQQQD